MQAIIRHGLVPAGSAIPGVPPVKIAHRSYLIELDVFCALAQPWDEDLLSRQFETMHAQIDRFFRWTLTESGESEFGLEPKL